MQAARVGKSMTPRLAGVIHRTSSTAKDCETANPRLATTCEWDVAAGGKVMSPSGSPLAYGRATENFRVPAFIAWGDPDKAVLLKT